MSSPVLTYFQVTQVFTTIQTNQTPGTLTTPVVEPSSGTAIFTCSHPEIESAPLDRTVSIDPIMGRWSSVDGVLSELDGVPGVGLTDNQFLGLDPGVLTYRVDYSNLVWDNNSDQNLDSFRFAAPGDGSTVDLTTVTRLPL